MKIPNRVQHASAPFKKKWENVNEDMENQIDVEFGNLPQEINAVVNEEKKNEARDGIYIFC